MSEVNDWLRAEVARLEEELRIERQKEKDTTDATTPPLHRGREVNDISPASGKTGYRMSYWVLLNLSFFVSCVIAVTDRFTANSITGGVLGETAFDELTEKCSAEKGSEDAAECKPYVLYFNIIIRATARILVVAFCFFFFTMCRATNNWLLEMVDGSPFLSRFFDLSDAASAIYEGHKYLGFVFMGVLIVHLSSVFVPLGELDFNLDNEDPVWFILSPIERHIPFTGVEGKWTIRTDDFIQLAFGTLIVLFVQPLTIVWTKYRTRYFNFTQALHIGGAVGVIWLFYRVPEHLRVFAINTPFLVLYAFDRIIHTWYYRAKELDRSGDYETLTLDKDYAIMFFPLWRKADSSVPSKIGDVYYLAHSKMKREPFKHPFTHFRYRRPAQRDLMSFSSIAGVANKQSFIARSHAVRFAEGPGEADDVGKVHVELTNKMKEMKSWIRHTKAPKCDLIGTVVQIKEEGKAKHQGWWGPKSFTQTLHDETQEGTVSVLGPYRRVYLRLMRPSQPCPYIVIGSGSGCSFLLDFVYWVREQHESSDKEARLRFPVHAVFTTRSRALLLFVSDILFKVSIGVPLLTCAIHFTSKDFEETGKVTLSTDRALDHAIEPSRNPTSSEKPKFNSSHGRAPSASLREGKGEEQDAETAQARTASVIYAAEDLDIPTQEGLVTVNTHIGHNQTYLETKRFDINDVLKDSDPSTEIYFCGSTALHDIFKSKCKQAERAFFSDTPYL